MCDRITQVWRIDFTLPAHQSYVFYQVRLFIQKFIPLYSPNLSDAIAQIFVSNGAVFIELQPFAQLMALHHSF